MANSPEGSRNSRTGAEVTTKLPSKETQLSWLGNCSSCSLRIAWFRRCKVAHHHGSISYRTVCHSPRTTNSVDGHPGGGWTTRRLRQRGAARQPDGCVVPAPVVVGSSPGYTRSPIHCHGTGRSGSAERYRLVHSSTYTYRRTVAKALGGRIGPLPFHGRRLDRSRCT